VGVALGRLLDAGDVVAFSGDLGAGKTCCIQGIAAGMEVSAETAVTSPTFTLIHEYAGRVPIYHVDVYRLNHEEDLYDLGYEEYFYGQGVTLIEWAERIAAFLPSDHLAIRLQVEPDQARRLQFQAVGARAAQVLARLQVSD
jgi:tRNA threonylcarbamoyladenosine biosynthesis protein TsaE